MLLLAPYGRSAATRQSWKYFHLESILLQSYKGFDVICTVLENSGKLAGVNLLFLVTKNKN